MKITEEDIFESMHVNQISISFKYTEEKIHVYYTDFFYEYQYDEDGDDEE